MHQKIINDMRDTLHSCDEGFSSLDEEELEGLVNHIIYSEYEDFEDLVKSDECPDLLISYTKMFASAMLCYIQIRESQKNIAAEN